MIQDFNVLRTCTHTISQSNSTTGEIELVSLAEACTICRNQNFVFDYQIDSSGNPIYLGGNLKTQMDVFKLLLTELGDNPFLNSYGIKNWFFNHIESCLILMDVKLLFPTLRQVKTTKKLLQNLHMYCLSSKIVLIEDL